MVPRLHIGKLILTIAGGFQRVHHSHQFPHMTGKARAGGIDGLREPHSAPGQHQLWPVLTARRNAVDERQHRIRDGLRPGCWHLKTCALGMDVRTGARTAQSVVTALVCPVPPCPQRFRIGLLHNYSL